MRNFKFLAILAALAFSTLMLSCNNTEALPEEYYGEDEILNIERDITFEVATRAGSVAFVGGSFSVSYNTAVERVISYTISPEILEATGMTKQELDAYLKEHMDAEDYNDLVSYAKAEPGTRPNDIDMSKYDVKTHMGCMQYCRDRYTTADGKKISGRGVCKADCWIDSAVRILQGAAAAIKII